MEIRSETPLKMTVISSLIISSGMRYIDKKCFII